MNENSFFEMPIGFSLAIGINEPAIQYFAGLDRATKEKIKEYIQNEPTGELAKEKVDTAIKALEHHSTSFLS